MLPSNTPWPRCLSTLSSRVAGSEQTSTTPLRRDRTRRSHSMPVDEDAPSGCSATMTVAAERARAARRAGGSSGSARRAAGEVDRRERRVALQHVEHALRRSRAVMISVRFGPASTWQWWQAWLQRLPTFTWSVRGAARRSGPSPRARARRRSRARPRRPRPLLTPSAAAGECRRSGRDTDGTPHVPRERPGARAATAEFSARAARRDLCSWTSTGRNRLRPSALPCPSTQPPGTAMPNQVRRPGTRQILRPPSARGAHLGDRRLQHRGSTGFVRWWSNPGLPSRDRCPRRAPSR